MKNLTDGQLDEIVEIIKQKYPKKSDSQSLVEVYGACERKANRQLQLKQSMLISLDHLTAELYDSDRFSHVEKIHFLYEGYDMMLRLMDEIIEKEETQPTTQEQKQ